MINKINVYNYKYSPTDISFEITGKIKDSNAFIKDLCDLIKKHEVSKDDN